MSESGDPSRSIRSELVRQVEPLLASQDLGSAVRRVVDSSLPALPVTDDRDRLCGIFGEREFIGAIFPPYVGQLSYAGFVPRTLEAQLEKRKACLSERVSEHMNSDHIDVGPGYSETQLAETFLHHRVLIVPVVDQGRIQGVITRWDFFRMLVERVEDATG